MVGPLRGTEGTKRKKGISVPDESTATNEQVQEGPRETEERNFDLLKDCPYPIIVINPNSSIRYVNPALEKRTGFSSTEIVGQKPPYPWWIEGAMEKTTAGFQQAVHADMAEVEEVFQDKNGRRFRVKVTSTWIRNDNDKLPYCLASWTDVSGSEKAADGLGKSRSFLEGVLDAIPAAVTIIDRDYRIVLANRTAQESTGVTEREFGRLRCHQVFHHRDTPCEETLGQCPLRQILSTKAPVKLQHILCDADNNQTRLEIIAAPIFNEAGDVVEIIAFCRDMAEHNGAQRTFGEAERQFLEARKIESLGRLAGGIIHDFRNQLAVIKGYGEALLRRDLVKEEGREEVEEILQAAKRAKAVTDQLLLLSRTEVLEPKVVNVAELLANTTKSLRRIIGENVRLSVIASDWNCYAEIDPSQFQQAIVSVCANARDIMPEGGELTIRATCVELDSDFVERHGGISSGLYIMVAISGTGRDGDRKSQEKILEPFFATNDVNEGTGFGLAMVYGFVRQSGGIVEVEDEPGKGSTFKLYFPRVAGTEELTNPAAVEDTLPSGSETILVVEDEEPVRHMVARSLRECGYTVLESSNAQEALPEGEHYDGDINMLITDVVMPGMSGTEVAKRIKDARPNIQVLYISGYAEKDLENYGLGEANGRLLAKPFSLEHLARTVREMLGGCEEPAACA